MDYQVCHAVEAFALLIAVSRLSLQIIARNSSLEYCGISEPLLTDWQVVSQSISHISLFNSSRFLRSPTLGGEEFCMTQAGLRLKSSKLRLPRRGGTRTFNPVHRNWTGAGPFNGRFSGTKGLRESPNRSDSVMSGGKYRQEASCRQHQSDAFLKTDSERAIARLARPPPDPHVKSHPLVSHALAGV